MINGVIYGITNWSVAFALKMSITDKDKPTPHRCLMNELSITLSFSVEPIDVCRCSCHDSARAGVRL